MKKELKQLVRVLENFQAKLNAFDEDVVRTWSIESLCEELDELIAQTNDELSDEE